LSDGQVWLLAGDVARMDEDGYFHSVDYKKEAIGE
jgi:long-subunit acyl-CoA synthetase (AMP-forming)